MRKQVFLFAAMLSIVGCSSGPTAVEYYMLTPFSVAQSPAITGCDLGKPVVIEAVELPAYLRQSGLALQTAPNSVRLSRTHLWAEQLDQALPRSLMLNLQQLSGGCEVLQRGRGAMPAQYLSLYLRVDHFQATSEGEVITSGQFHVVDSTMPGKTLSGEFNASRNLEQDGYTHAVMQLGDLSRYIAEEVLAALEREGGGRR
jgi:uncharacterized lipoprotein YmbA